MQVITLLIPIVMAACGLWMLFDFMTWEVKGTKIYGRIDDFHGAKKLGVRLPVVSFEKPDGETLQAKAQRIDRMLYYLANPVVGGVTPVIYRQEEGKLQVRVYGLMRMAAGLLLLLPLVAVTGLLIGQTILIAQAAYVAIFALIIIGGMAFMQFIQRNY